MCNVTNVTYKCSRNISTIITIGVRHTPYEVAILVLADNAVTIPFHIATIINMLIYNS